MNKVNLIATLTRDIELGYTQSGAAIASFGVALNERWKDQTGAVQEKAHFVDCTAFGKRAETINKHFRKGSRIGISGSLSYESWTNQAGEKRSKLGVKVDDFYFIDRRQGGQQQNQAQPTQQRQHNSVMPENTTLEIDTDEIPF
jgi:single-strand DNA-binding protein